MKIKFKQTTMPNISNITFDFNKPKHNRYSSTKNKTTQNQKLIQFSLDSHLKSNQSHNPNKKPSQQKLQLSQKVCNQISLPLQQIQFQQKKSCLLLKYSSFIPKNPNINSSIFSKQRFGKPIQSLQSAKQVEKRFPVRKVLTKRTSVGFFIKRNKNFQFSNPQTQVLELFENNKISNSMIRSQSLPFSKKNKQFVDNELICKRNSIYFQKINVGTPLISSTTSLSFRVNQNKHEKQRALTRISNLNI